MIRRSWLLWAAVVVALVLLFVMCTGSTESQASQAQGEPANKTSFTVQLESTDTRARGQCYRWGFGPYENRDGYNRLRFGYGEDVTACLNRRGTRWVALPEFDPYHYLGYWKHEKTNKSRSSLGYSFLSISTLWKFSWTIPSGFATFHKDRTLRCRLEASNHTAYCTLYY